MDWFSSPYYEILYAHRDTTEAEIFVDSLIERAILVPPAQILDAGCGRARLSYGLAKKNFSVDAIDQATFIPQLAAQTPFPNLKFFHADYHTWKPPYPYAGIISFFTSLGYHAHVAQLITLLKHWHALLSPNGVLIIDYLNIFLRNPLPYEERQVRGIKFVIHRWHDPLYLYKKVEVYDQAQRFDFQERILKLTQGDWFYALGRARLRVRQIWGSYDARPFDVSQSPRLIIFAQKDAHLS
ncbi:MAG: class I SAM-dependent methyltransferase [Bacteroidia bacterium]